VYTSLVHAQTFDTFPDHIKAVIKDFTKIEALPSRAARVISPEPPEVNVAVAPIVWALSKGLKDLPFMVKGLNLDQKNSKLMRLLGRRVAAGDFTLYDNSERDLVRMMELELVRRFLPWAFEVYDEYVWWVTIVKRCHVDGVRVGSRLVPYRLSGESGTSLFNGLWNAFRVYFSSYIHGYLMDWDAFVVEGDDSLDALTPPEYMVDDCALVGLTVKVEPGRTLLTCGFLGRFHYVENGKVRSQCDIFRTLRKYHFSAQTSGASDVKDLCVAKSLSYLATDYNTPIVGAVAWAFVRRHRKTSARAVQIYRRRFLDSGRELDSLYTLPAPRPSAAALACAVMQTALSQEILNQFHMFWIDHGLGGPEPIPLPLMLKDQAHLYPI
jgi:hypothetical protein